VIIPMKKAGGFYRVGFLHFCAALRLATKSDTI